MEPNAPVSPTPPTAAPAPQPAAVPARPQLSVEPQTVVIDTSALVLTAQIASRSDVSKSLRELDRLDDFFHQANLRGSNAKDVPNLGVGLESLAQGNKLNLLKAEDRALLKAFLTRLKTKAPVVHMSFPSKASNDFIATLLTWFRKEVHPHALLHIGLQPELAAGCVVRTTNKMFDFSFRKRFEKSKQLLIAALEAQA